MVFPLFFEVIRFSFFPYIVYWTVIVNTFFGFFWKKFGRPRPTIDLFTRKPFWSVALPAAAIGRIGDAGIRSHAVHLSIG